MESGPRLQLSSLVRRLKFAFFDNQIWLEDMQWMRRPGVASEGEYIIRELSPQNEVVAGREPFQEYKGALHVACGTGFRFLTRGLADLRLHDGSQSPVARLIMSNIRAE